MIRTLISTVNLFGLWSVVGFTAAAQGIIPPLATCTGQTIGDAAIFGLQIAVASMMFMLSIIFLPYIFKTVYRVMSGDKLSGAEWGSFGSQAGFILMVLFLSLRNIIEVSKVLAYESVNIPWAATKLTYDSFIPYIGALCGALLMVLTFEKRRRNGLASGIVLGLTIAVWIIGGAMYYYVFVA